MSVYEDLLSLVGADQPAMVATDEVCRQMIRHWCEAMQDGNPLYLDDGYARRGPYGSIIAPPAMAQSWVIPPLWPPAGMPPVYEKIFGACAGGGYDQIIDTDCEMRFVRPLFPGDREKCITRVYGVSKEKRTGLGSGFFITLESDYSNQRDERVCLQYTTILMYRGSAGGPVGGGGVAAKESASGVGTGSEQAPTAGSSGRELGGETRTGQAPTAGAPAQPAACESGKTAGKEISADAERNSGAVVAGSASAETGFTAWGGVQQSNSPWNIGRAGGASASAGGVGWDDIGEGLELPVRSREMTATAIIAAAIASRDFSPLHHDHRAAQNGGLRDIFVNIITSGGLVSKYLTDWTGPEGEIRRMKFRLGVPCCAGDTLTMSGRVTGKAVREGRREVDVTYRFDVEAGAHCSGEATMELR